MVVHERLSVVSQLGVDVSTIGEGGGVIRIQANRLVEILDGSDVMSQSMAGMAADSPQLVVFRREADRLRIIFNCCTDEANLTVQFTAVAVGAGETRV